MKSLLFSLLFLISFSLSAQNELLQSGPMVGYSGMMEVLLWVQTKNRAKVAFRYWDVESPKEKFQTATVRTEKEQAFTAKLVADQVVPGKKYAYELLINGKPVKLSYPTTFQSQSLWQWRTDPPDFTMAIGSCTYINETHYDRPGDPYGGDYQIFTSIHQMKPDAMLWLGDNIYLREVDWHTRTGIMHRYTHSRSLPELQPLLASTHHYAIWDDHDFGPNDSDRSFIHKDITTEAFELFWGNPSFGLPEQEGVTSYFQFHDIDFFLLDNRYFRSPNNRKSGEKTILGKEQLEWLIDALTSSSAPYKMVAIGGQVLNPAAVYENYASHHREEREYLLKRIEEEDIKGVVFLTGDRHHTELSKFKNLKGNMIYDITISPLTSGAAKEVEDVNPLRVDSTLITQRNFGMLEFSGLEEERKLRISVYDVDGNPLWAEEIKE